jgi:hypothetical protein
VLYSCSRGSRVLIVSVNMVLRLRLIMVAVDVSPSIARQRDSRGSLFGLQRMQNSMVNAKDSRFILVRPLDHDQVIALRPVWR